MEYSVGANGIGGTQTTVVRVAVALSQRFKVVVAQKERQIGEFAESGGVTWLALSEADEYVKQAHAVVLITREPQAIVEYRRKNEGAKFLVWNHDWQQLPKYRRSPWIRLLRRLNATKTIAKYRAGKATAITVSDAHKFNMESFFKSSFVPRGIASKIPVVRVYNPVQDLRPDPSVQYDADQLIYFSAAWKGLDLVLKAFDSVVAAIPTMKLLVASPGYATPENGYGALPNRPLSDRVKFVGSLDSKTLFDEVRRSLCVFYPANRVPETFGLVFAESHAVGTPVIAHPFGAAPEILCGAELIDASDTGKIVDTLKSWRAGGRPVVQKNPSFDIENVAAAWYSVLN